MLRWRLGPRKNADSVHSGTHPRFYGSTQDRDRDQDRTPEHILVFRAILEIEIEIEIEIAPVHGRGTLCTSPTTQKKHEKGTSDKQTDRQTNTHRDY